MKRLTLLLSSAILAGPVHAQTPPASAPVPSALTCGVLKSESTRTGTTSRWTISTRSGNVTETGTLRTGPRFECIDGAILTVEFTSTAGSSIFNAYFPDGSDISYGRQQIDHRGSRVVLPIQAKARIAAPFRAAFDYHCRLDMPADPIAPGTRADCIF
jgi:hypothetical protein